MTFTGDSETLRLSLETVSDVYSKFDDRPFPKRDLSRSFIAELLDKAWARGEFGKVEIKVKKKAKKGELAEAEGRISDYFSELERKLRNEQREHRFKGTACIILGGALLTAQVKIYSEDGNLAWLLLLPAGWLAVFLGAEYIFSDWKLAPEYAAAKRLKEAELAFSK